MTIRSGGPADLAFVRALAAESFAAFGDYGRIVEDWIGVDGVHTFVVEEEGRAIGFTMIGFYRLDDGTWTADLLAIAVAPSEQRRGVGRKLLDHAVAAARAARHHLPVRELRLSVADTNQRARAIFAAAGFREVPGDHGRYDGGQRALHMAKRL